jgi:hypothetical protein
VPQAATNVLGHVALQSTSQTPQPKSESHATSGRARVTAAQSRTESAVLDQISLTTSG